MEALCWASLLKNGASVSAPLALPACQTLLQPSRLLWLGWGDGAGAGPSSRGDCQAVKEQKQQPATSQPPSICLHLAVVTVTPILPLLRLSLSPACPNTPLLLLSSSLSSSTLFVFLSIVSTSPSVRKHRAASWERSLSLTQTWPDTALSWRSVDSTRCQAQSICQPDGAPQGCVVGLSEFLFFPFFHSPSLASHKFLWREIKLFQPLEHSRSWKLLCNTRWIPNLMWLFTQPSVSTLASDQGAFGCRFFTGALAKSHLSPTVWQTPARSKWERCLIHLCLCESSIQLLCCDFTSIEWVWHSQVFVTRHLTLPHLLSKKQWNDFLNQGKLHLGDRITNNWVGRSDWARHVSAV